MKKIFEIPIYALSPEQLREKVEIKSNEIKKRMLAHNCNGDIIERTVEMVTFPKKSWEYNHIVGYIQIWISNSDVSFELFMTYEECKRYIWNSNRKKLLYNTSITGMHFRVCDEMQNKDISKKMQNMLDIIISENIPRRYYVDLESFNTSFMHINYREIMKSEGLVYEENENGVN